MLTFIALDKFVCPIDKNKLRQQDGKLHCVKCGGNYPVINGIPVLIDDSKSVFRIADYTRDTCYGGASSYVGALDKTTGWRKAYRNFAMKLSETPVVGADAIDPCLEVSSVIQNPKILVIGSGERSYVGDITYTDVTFAKGVSCICDAHDLPFPDQYFDAVFADSVLEHVCDPERCVAEMIRVLKPQGFVWAVTPFLQPVHMGKHDFTRFTYVGYRRLFANFEDIRSGMCGGPIYSLIHLLRQIILGFSTQRRLRPGLRLVSFLVTYPMRYLDRFFCREAGAYNSACAFYFLGRKRETRYSDREIIEMFRGR